MACREVVELVNGYLEGTLPVAERIRFEEHLGDCPGCVTYLDQMRATVAATRRLSEDNLDPQVRDELLRAFRDWPREGTAEA
jgi:anti-sigma factor RsiW